MNKIKNVEKAIAEYERLEEELNRHGLNEYGDFLLYFLYKGKHELDKAYGSIFLNDDYLEDVLDTPRDEVYELRFTEYGEYIRNIRVSFKEGYIEDIHFDFTDPEKPDYERKRMNINDLTYMWSKSKNSLSNEFFYIEEGINLTHEEYKEFLMHCGIHNIKNVIITNTYNSITDLGEYKASGNNINHLPFAAYITIDYRGYGIYIMNTDYQAKYYECTNGTVIQYEKR